MPSCFVLTVAVRVRFFIHVFGQNLLSDVNFTKLVLDDSKLHTMAAVSKNMIEQGSLTGAKKAREDEDSHRDLAMERLSVCM